MSEREEVLDLDPVTLTPIVRQASTSAPERDVFETGEVLEPRVAIDRTSTPTITGLVHFDDEAGETRVSVKVRRSTSAIGAIVVELTPASDEHVEIQVLEHTVFDADTSLRSSFEDPTETVADLDGSDDAADWIQPGYVLDADDVEYLRGLVIPSSVRRYGES